jgi:uncharacterized protein YdeI (YjbR/CyaY-like superfamily)
VLATLPVHAMPNFDPRVDAYIAKSADFARPILIELRARVHAVCPDVVEGIKWSMPAFDYHGPLAHMAAFKKHCAFGLWKHKLVVGDGPKAQESMGSYGMLTTLEELPTKAQFAQQLKLAMKLNEQGIKLAKPKKTAKKAVAPHPDFARALSRNKSAQAGFAGLTPGQQREYVEWIAGAKQEATRLRRIEQALEWLAEGKPRNWKYMKR